MRTLTRPTARHHGQSHGEHDGQELLPSITAGSRAVSRAGTTVRHHGQYHGQDVDLSMMSPCGR